MIVSVQQSLADAWVDSDLLQGQGTEYNSAYTSPFEGGAITFITPTIVWPQAKQLEGNTAPLINRKLDKRFTEHGSTHQNKTQFPQQFPVALIWKLP